MILIIDNYDSFTYNIFQYCSELGADVKVIRNDQITIPEVQSISPEKIIISPGPSNPKNAGISNEIIKKLGQKVPILGICLGHQCIGYSFGGIVENAGEIMHGKKSLIHHDEKGVFNNLPNPISAIRYHSLAINKENLPEELTVTAWTDTGIIMGIRHKTFPIEGIQFHPESIMTTNGKDILENFLNY